MLTHNGCYAWGYSNNFSTAIQASNYMLKVTIETIEKDMNLLEVSKNYARTAPLT